MSSSKFLGDLRNAFFRNTPAFSVKPRSELRTRPAVAEKQPTPRRMNHRSWQLSVLAAAFGVIAVAAGTVVVIREPGNPPQVIGDPNKAGESSLSDSPANPPLTSSTDVVTTGAVDFQFDTDGRALPLDASVAGTTWAKSGVAVSTYVQQATLVCRDATGLALRISRPGLTAVNPVSGAGVYLASSLPDKIAQCNAVPLRLDFTKSLTAAKVIFTGLPGIRYTATFYLDNGTFQEIEATCTQIGAQCPIGLQIPGGGSPIKSIVFGHSKTVQESTTSITMLKKVGFTPIS